MRMSFHVHKCTKFRMRTGRRKAYLALNPHLCIGFWWLLYLVWVTTQILGLRQWILDVGLGWSEQRVLACGGKICPSWEHSHEPVMYWLGKWVLYKHGTLARTQLHKEWKHMSLGQVLGNTLLHSLLSIPIYLVFSIVEAGVAAAPVFKSINLEADNFLSSSLFEPTLNCISWVLSASSASLPAEIVRDECQDGEKGKCMLDWMPNWLSALRFLQNTWSHMLWLSPFWAPQCYLQSIQEQG